jgi:hypothetical protein
MGSLTMFSLSLSWQWIFQVKIVIMIVNLLDSVGVRRHDAHDQTITQRTISNHAAAAERMMHRDQICKISLPPPIDWCDGLT